MKKLLQGIFAVLLYVVLFQVYGYGQNTLAGTLTVQKWIKLQGDLPVAVAGSQNNFNPTGLDVSGILYLTADGDINITGIVPTTAPTGNDGRLLAVFNVDSADTITLVNQSASSTAANRLALGTDVALTPNGPGVWLIYDTNISRWRVFGGSGGGGTGGGGDGSVTSVALDADSTLFDTTGSPVTTTGTLAFALKTQVAHKVLVGPTTGTAAPTMRLLLAGDLPDLSTVYQPLNTKLTSIGGLTNAAGWLHNDGAGTFVYSTPTKTDVGLSNVANTAQVTTVSATGPLASSGGTTPNLTIAKATGSIDGYLAAADFAVFAAKGSGNGSVTSVDMTVPSILSVAGNPITTSGTLAVTLATQSANLVFAGPSSGSAATPTFRSLVALDVPTLNQNTTGSAAKWTTARNLAGNSVDGSAAVAFANAFIVQGTTDAGLSGAQFLGALGTGILKNTTTTGILSIAVAADFPTLNQNTTGSAATLTTARLINGTSFNGSADITVTAAAGTLTGTTLNSGVTASSLTSVGTIATGTWSATTIAANKGGTGLASYTTGDLLYASSSSALSARAAVATGQVLISQGTGTAPIWSASASLTSLTLTGGYTLSGVDNTAYSLFRVLGGTKNPGVFVSAVQSSGDVILNASGSTSGYALVFQVENTERARVNTNGLAVTGVISATSNFDVGAGVNTGQVFFNNTDVGVWRGASNSTSTGAYLNLGGYDGMTLSVGAAAIGSKTKIMDLSTSGVAVTGILSTSVANAVNIFASPGVSSVALQFQTNNVDRFRVGIPSASADLVFYSGTSTEVGRFSSSGLDVTGALSATTTITANGRIQSNYANPLIQWYNTSGGTDQKRWDFQATGTTFIGRMVNDADSAATSWLTVTRSGTSATSVALSATAVSVTGTIATGAPSGGSAAPWKIGAYSTGSLVQTGGVIVQISGVSYYLLAVPL